MPANLALTISNSVREGRYVIGLHASERLEERGIMEWQVIDAMADAVVLREQPDGVPNATANFELLLPDGTAGVAVWAWLPKSRLAKLVTVFYPEG